MVIRKTKQRSVQHTRAKYGRHLRIEPANPILAGWGAYTTYIITHIIFQIRFPFID